MLSIYTTADLIPNLQAIIAQEDRLDELVTIKDILDEKPESSAYNLIVRAKTGIAHPIDWYNLAPPYLMPEEIEPSAQNLLGLIFAKLGNYEKAYDLLAHNRMLLNDIDIINRLQQGHPADPGTLSADLSPFEEYRLYHNSAILHHYAATEQTFNQKKTLYFYEEALKSAPNGEYNAFTAKQFATFLTDQGELEGAERLLQDALRDAQSDDATLELKAGLCNVWMKKMVVPYDAALLERLKTTLWEVLEHYQKQQRSVEEGLLLIDAAQVANYAESFTESLGYINRAVDIFRTASIPELRAQAQYRRGILLYTWAKNGNPQFFRGALEAFQDALKVFTRDETPEVFADIQQYLGVIYSEIPDEALKKSIWAGISSSSFQQALDFYKKEQYPYEYAMICSNFANALSKYPEAVHSDNLEKALFYYTEALEIRIAAAWPLERAVTLLNYVETCWHLNLAGNGSNRALYEDMVAKATEARNISPDPAIKAEAEAQLKRLETLKIALDQE
ncbi:MAG: hypothetical protein WCR52_22205 [Bacteroidota bacterium]